jgi:5-methylcytosine-specific restriction endonuclease McrA
MVTVAEAAAAAASKPPSKPRKGEAARRFRSSMAWRRVRYAVLARANGRCECCGARASDSVRLHVDHIAPVSKAWDRRLDPDNLQVLCESCNVGKWDGPARDWRDGAVET